MTRILSGLKSSGDATLGNYIGAIRRWVQLQDTPETENIYFVPNLHALTVRPKPSVLRQDTLSMMAWLLASGLDPAKSIIFLQSHVPAHSELSWIFNNYVTMGELNRMTQFKDKARKTGAEGQLVGMYTYPALMAADILLYDIDEVPVGEDQIQHVELARNIAERFNNLYGEIFVLPKATIADSGARIMNLQDPRSKMSKSDEDQTGTIMMADSPDSIRYKVKRAVTDSGSEITAGPDKPAITNLLDIHSAMTGTPIIELEQRYGGVGYGQFKADVAEAIIAHIQPIQTRHAELMADPAAITAHLYDGRDKAATIAADKLTVVKQNIGLL